MVCGRHPHWKQTHGRRAKKGQCSLLLQEHPDQPSERLLDDKVFRAKDQDERQREGEEDLSPMGFLDGELGNHIAASASSTPAFGEWCVSGNMQKGLVVHCSCSTNTIIREI